MIASMPPIAPWAREVTRSARPASIFVPRPFPTTFTNLLSWLFAFLRSFFALLGEAAPAAFWNANRAPWIFASSDFSKLGVAMMPDRSSESMPSRRQVTAALPVFGGYEQTPLVHCTSRHGSDVEQLHGGTVLVVVELVVDVVVGGCVLELVLVDELDEVDEVDVVVV